MSNSKSPTFLKQPVNMNENSNHAPLSPAAGAVLDAFETRSLTSREWMDGKGARLKLAAALRTAADYSNEIDVPFSVVTEWGKTKGTCASFYAAAEWGYKLALKHQLAIAAELEGIGGKVTNPL